MKETELTARAQQGLVELRKTTNPNRAFAAVRLCGFTRDPSGLQVPEDTAMNLITTFGSPTVSGQGPEPEDPYGMDALAGYGVGGAATLLFIALAIGMQDTAGDLSRLAFKGIDAFSTLAFAVAGTYIAAEHRLLPLRQNMRNYMICFGGGMMTAVGGGVIRDIVTQPQIALMHDITLVAAGAIGAMLGLVFALIPNRLFAAAINLIDSIAVAVAIVVGTKKGISLQPELVPGAAVCCAMVCATFTTAGGGFLRDIFILRPPSALATVAFFLPSAGAIALVSIPQLLDRPEISRQSPEVWVAIVVLTIANVVLSRYKFRRPRD
jgi:uncharacterized membrane protein YeiH